MVEARAAATPSFGAVLLRYRRAAGLTHEALAEAAGLSARTISDLERGVSAAPRRDTLAALTAALGLAPEQRAALEAAARPPPGPAAETARPHNLPAELTSFVGREGELADVRALLAAARLVTLTGTGGCGKTRLALRVAGDLIGAYADGVWLVDLAPLADEARVPQAVLAALSLPEHPGRPPLEALAELLRPRRLLLLLDNCEHLVGAAAALALALLRASAGLTILATSRELLGVPGEVAWRVPSLAAPDPERLPPATELLAYPAVRLFIERTRLVRPDFALTAANAPDVARLCRRLDGMPLALELAAARAAVLTVEQIAGRLDDRFRLLTGGSRTALRRQQTLRAAIDWSHDLLAEAERALFRRLAVFAGGCTLAAAEQVGGRGRPLEPDDVLDLLTALVQKSLIVAEGGAGEARYGLPETIRQYAAEKLLDAGEAAETRERHLGFFLALAERAAPELTGPDQVAWLDQLDAEHGNLRAALAWSQAERETGTGLRLAAALARFWRLRGYVQEGRERLAHALARPGTPPGPARAAVLNWAGHLAFVDGDLPRARALLEEAVSAARRLPGQSGLAIALRHLAYVALGEDDPGAALSLHEEALASARREGDEREVAWGLFTVGTARSRRGDPEGGRRLAEEGLAACRARGDRLGVQQALSALGQIALIEGDHGRARTLLSEALEGARHLKSPVQVQSLAGLAEVALRAGDPLAAQAFLREGLLEARAGGARAQMAGLLGTCGALSAATGQSTRAARLFGATDGVGPMPTTWSGLPGHRERGLAAARAALGEAAFAAAWSQGRAMTLEEAVAEALGEDGSPPGPGEPPVHAGDGR